MREYEQMPWKEFNVGFFSAKNMSDTDIFMYALIHVQRDLIWRFFDTTFFQVKILHTIHTINYMIKVLITNLSTQRYLK